MVSETVVSIRKITQLFILNQIFLALRPAGHVATNAPRGFDFDAVSLALGKLMNHSELFVGKYEIASGLIYGF